MKIVAYLCFSNLRGSNREEYTIFSRLRFFCFACITSFFCDSIFLSLASLSCALALFFHLVRVLCCSFFLFAHLQFSFLFLWYLLLVAFGLFSWSLVFSSRVYLDYRNFVIMLPCRPPKFGHVRCQWYTGITSSRSH